MNRKEKFAVGEYYHIYNRGTDKRAIFLDTADLARFMESVVSFNDVSPVGSLYVCDRSIRRGETPTDSHAKLVDIIAYCFNPNHYHLILSQKKDNGISEFMKRLGGGYTSYFNDRYKRTGVLFQGVFKSVHVKTNEQLLHLSAYVNLNNRFKGKPLLLSLSSWEEYVEKNNNCFCDKRIILDQFSGSADYRNFAMNALSRIIEKKKLDKETAKMLME